MNTQIGLVAIACAITGLGCGAIPNDGESTGVGKANDTIDGGTGTPNEGPYDCSLISTYTNADGETASIDIEGFPVTVDEGQVCLVKGENTPVNCDDAQKDSVWSVSLNLQSVAFRSTLFLDITAPNQTEPTEPMARAITAAGSPVIGLFAGPNPENPDVFTGTSATCSLGF